MSAATALYMALRYLAHRKFATIVSVGAIALSLCFVIGVGAVNFALKRTAVEGAIRYPLVVGSQSASAVQLIFSTLFHLDKPTGTIPFEVYEALRNDRRVLAAFPLAMADSLANYPIVGTTGAFLEDLGAPPIAGGLTLSEAGDAVLGYEVARRLGLTVGATFHGTHGMVGDEGAHVHREFAYRVVGVLSPIGGPEDSAVYTPYETVWAMHADGHGRHDEKHEAEREHQPSRVAEEQDHAEREHEGHDRHHLGAGRLTGVLVRTANPVYTAQLEREWSLAPGAQGVDTGRTIRRLVSYLNRGERVAGIFSALALSVAVIMILVTLIMSLEQRRKEMALLRAVGAGRFTLALVVLFEALLLTLAGVAAGVALGHGAVWWGAGWIQGALGVGVEPWVFTSMELWGVAIALAAGQALGVVAWLWTYQLKLVEEIARE